MVYGSLPGASRCQDLPSRRRAPVHAEYQMIGFAHDSSCGPEEPLSRHVADLKANSERALTLGYHIVVVSACGNSTNSRPQRPTCKMPERPPATLAASAPGLRRHTGCSTIRFSSQGRGLPRKA